MSCYTATRELCIDFIIVGFSDYFINHTQYYIPKLGIVYCNFSKTVSANA